MDELTSHNVEKENAIKMLEDLLEQVKNSEVVSTSLDFKTGFVEYVGEDFWRQVRPTGELDISLDLKLYCHKRNQLKSLK